MLTVDEGDLGILVTNGRCQIMLAKPDPAGTDRNLGQQGSILSWRIPALSNNGDNFVDLCKWPGHNPLDPTGGWQAFNTIRNHCNCFAFYQAVGGAQITPITSNFTKGNYSIQVQVRTKAWVHIRQDWNFSGQFGSGHSLFGGGLLTVRWTFTEYQIYWWVEFTRTATGSLGGFRQFISFNDVTKPNWTHTMLNRIASDGTGDVRSGPTQMTSSTADSNFYSLKWFEYGIDASPFTSAGLMGWGVAQYQWDDAGRVFLPSPGSLFLRTARTQRTGVQNEIAIELKKTTNLLALTSFSYPLLFYCGISPRGATDLEELWADYSRPFDFVSNPANLTCGRVFSGAGSRGFSRKFGCYHFEPNRDSGGNVLSGAGSVMATFNSIRNGAVDSRDLPYRWPVVVVGNLEGESGIETYDQKRAPKAKISGAASVCDEDLFHAGPEYTGVDYASACDLFSNTGTNKVGIVQMIGPELPASGSGAFDFEAHSGMGVIELIPRYHIFASSLTLTLQPHYRVLADTISGIFFEPWSQGDPNGNATDPDPARWTQAIGIKLDGFGFAKLDPTFTEGAARSIALATADMRVEGLFTTPKGQEGRHRLIAKCGQGSQNGGVVTVDAGIVAARVNKDLFFRAVDKGNPGGDEFDLALKLQNFFDTGGACPGPPYHLIIESFSVTVAGALTIYSRILVADVTKSNEVQVLPDPAGSTSPTYAVFSPKGALLTNPPRVGISFRTVANPAIDRNDSIRVFTLEVGAKPQIVAVGPFGPSEIRATLVGSTFVPGAGTNQVLSSSEWKWAPFGQGFESAEGGSTKVTGTNQVTIGGLRPNSAYIVKFRYFGRNSGSAQGAEDAGVSDWSEPFFLATGSAGTNALVVPGGGHLPEAPPAGYALEETQEWFADSIVWADGSESRASRTQFPRRSFRITWPMLIKLPDTTRLSQADVILKFFARVKGRSGDFYVVDPINLDVDGRPEVIKVRVAGDDVHLGEWSASLGVLDGEYVTQFLCRQGIALIEVA